MFNPTPYFLYMYEDDRKEKLDKAAQEIALYAYEYDLHIETRFIESILSKYNLYSLSAKEKEYLNDEALKIIEGRY